MSTLAVVEEILRETAVPMSVREIVEHAGLRLPSKSKTPDTVVARDLSMDIKKKGEGSLFIRTAPGRYTLRTLAAHGASVSVVNSASVANIATEVANNATAVAPEPIRATTSMSALSQRKPAAAAPTAPTAPTSARARTDSDVQGGGFAG